MNTFNLQAHPILKKMKSFNLSELIDQIVINKYANNKNIENDLTPRVYI